MICVGLVKRKRIMLSSSIIDILKGIFVASLLEFAGEVVGLLGLAVAHLAH